MCAYHNSTRCRRSSVPTLADRAPTGTSTCAPSWVEEKAKSSTAVAVIPKANTEGGCVTALSIFNRRVRHWNKKLESLLAGQW